jgi:hypothetical protein
VPECGRRRERTRGQVAGPDNVAGAGPTKTGPTKTGPTKTGRTGTGRARGRPVDPDRPDLGELGVQGRQLMGSAAARWLRRWGRSSCRCRSGRCTGHRRSQWASRAACACQGEHRDSYHAHSDRERVPEGRSGWIADHQPRAPGGAPVAVWTWPTANLQPSGTLGVAHLVGTPLQARGTRCVPASVAVVWLVPARPCGPEAT